MEVGTTAATTAAADKYRASLRLNAETVAISRDVASALVMQSEQLDQTETALDVTQQVVGQANYVVRGMSWSGWLANKFSKEPTVVLPHASAPSKEIAMGFICPECRVAQVSQRALMEHYESAHASPPATVSLPSNGSDDQDDVYASDNGLTKEQAAYLAALGPQLLELKHASKGISNHLDMQLAQLDRIEAKSEKTKDDMRLVTAKATKLTSSLLTISPQFRCAFQELTTQKFVANVNGDPVVCKDAASANCLFRAFTLADSTDMWGFRSESSGLFLGINALGAMRIQGAGLKSYEQFAIDVSRPQTTLFSFASCFGLGGWVSMRPDGSLFCIRRTSTNKDMAALFKLVRVEG